MAVDFHLLDDNIKACVKVKCETKLRKLCVPQITEGTYCTVENNKGITTAFRATRALKTSVVSYCQNLY